MSEYSNTPPTGQNKNASNANKTGIIDDPKLDAVIQNATPADIRNEWNEIAASGLFRFFCDHALGAKDGSQLLCLARTPNGETSAVLSFNGSNNPTILHSTNSKQLPIIASENIDPTDDILLFDDKTDFLEFQQQCEKYSTQAILANSSLSNNKRAIQMGRIFASAVGVPGENDKPTSFVWVSTSGSNNFKDGFTNGLKECGAVVKHADLRRCKSVGKYFDVFGDELLIKEASATPAYYKLADIESEFFEELARRRGRKRVATGIATLDNRLGGGLMPGYPTYLAGGTGALKTTIATEIGTRLASQGLPVYFYSLEMDRDDLVFRAIALAYGLNWGDVVLGLHERECREFFKKHGRGHFIVKDQNKVPTIEEYRRDLLRMKEVFPDKQIVTFVDYAQLVKAGVVDGDKRAITESGVMQLRKIAAETGVVMIVISQINRASYSNGQKPPAVDSVLKSAKETGQIEYDAQVLIGITAMTPENSKDVGPQPLWLTVAKNRWARWRGNMAIEFNALTGEITEINNPETYVRATTDDERKAQILEYCVANDVTNKDAIRSVLGCGQNAANSLFNDLVDSGQLVRIQTARTMEADTPISGHRLFDYSLKDSGSSRRLLPPVQGSSVGVVAMAVGEKTVTFGVVMNLAVRE